MEDTDLRTIQKPLKDSYRADPEAAQITLRASGSQADVAVACSVDLGRAIYEAQAHTRYAVPNLKPSTQRALPRSVGDTSAAGAWRL